MFGLPGAALAMIWRRRSASSDGGKITLSVAITAFLTGVTEPLEFLFMFRLRCCGLLHAVRPVSACSSATRSGSMRASPSRRCNLTTC
ncbi:PTS transporter subunit EIIC [Klebsiella pneumoniae subsp. pneumoniae]|nr:PTS transporter subunit EIIC [Klebsiella pneumoniae subsp. pneumoniae]